MLALPLAYTLIGFFLAPAIIRSQLTTTLSDLFDRPVAIAKVHLNPYSLEFAVEGFRLPAQDGGHEISFAKLYANFQLSSLFNSAWTFEEVRLTNPNIHLVRGPSGLINLQQLAPASSDVEPADNNPDAETPPILIRNLHIEAGELAFSDQAVAPNFATTLTPLTLALRNLDTRQGAESTFTLDIRGEADTSLAAKGTLSITPLTITGNLRATGPYLPLAYRYLDNQLKVRLDSGSVDLNLNFAVAMKGQDAHVDVHHSNLAITDLRLIDKADDGELLALNAITLSAVDFAWPQKTLSVGNLTVNAPTAQLRRESDGLLNWQRLFASVEPAPNTTATAATAPIEAAETSSAANLMENAVVENTAEESSATVEQISPVLEQPSAPPPPIETQTNQLLPDWQISLATFAITNAAATIRDLTLREPAQFSVGANLSMADLSNQPNASFATDVAANLNGGTVTFNGDLKITPEWQLRGELAINDLPLTLADPYITDVLNASLSAGTLNLVGKVAGSASRPLTLAADMGVTGLDFLRLPSKRPLVQWQALEIKGMAITANPLSLAINNLTLEQPYLRFRIREDGSNNFERLVKQVDANPAPQVDVQVSEEPSAPSEPPRVVVQHIAVGDATINFADYTLPIPFDDKLHKLSGEISALSTVEKTPGSVDLQGQVGKYGAVKVSGDISTWDLMAQTDILVDLKNIEMPQLKPYSIKFLGREIDQGRMNLKLQYRFDEGHLQGQNDIVLTHLELGKKVPHPDALDLPLDLAMALLTGPDGNIDINLPVTGDTNNPTFSIGSIVVKVFSNLIVKAATAPFKLLGALIGMDNEKFDRVYFEPGNADVSPPEREKIHKLTEALSQRPQLGIEIKGVFAPKTDPVALRERTLNGRIETARAEKYGEASDVPRARQKLTVLEALYSEARGEEALLALRTANPVDEEGNWPTIYRDELRNSLLETIPVEPQELQELAQQRADNILAELTADNRFSPDKITIRTPEASGKVGKNGVSLKLSVAPIN